MKNMTTGGVEPLCQCSTAPGLIFACSGAADVGELADRAARRLTKENFGKMYCLAGVGARVPEMLEMVARAGRLLAIDGCSVGCASKTLQQAGFTNFAHLQLEHLGFQKGQSPPTYDHIQRVAVQASKLLANGKAMG